MLYTDPNRPCGSQSETPSVQKAPDGSWLVTGYQHFVLSADLSVREVLKKPAKFSKLRQLWQRLHNEEQCHTLLDVGCNSGLAGFLARDVGIEQVRCIDHDSEYVASVQQMAGDRLVASVVPFGHDLGAPVDIVHCGALIHWIYSLTANYRNFGKILQYLLGYVRPGKFLCLEWVDPQDGSMQSFKHNRKLQPADQAYTLNNFEQAVHDHGILFQRFEIDGPHRVMYVIQRQNPSTV